MRIKVNEEKKGHKKKHYFMKYIEWETEREFEDFCNDSGCMAFNTIWMGAKGGRRGEGGWLGAILKVI